VEKKKRKEDSNYVAYLVFFFEKKKGMASNSESEENDGNVLLSKELTHKEGEIDFEVNLEKKDNSSSIKLKYSVRKDDKDKDKEKEIEKKDQTQSSLPESEYGILRELRNIILEKRNEPPIQRRRTKKVHFLDTGKKSQTRSKDIKPKILKRFDLDIKKEDDLFYLANVAMFPLFSFEPEEDYLYCQKEALGPKFYDSPQKKTNLFMSKHFSHGHCFESYSQANWWTEETSNQEHVIYLPVDHSDGDYIHSSGLYDYFSKELDDLKNQNDKRKKIEKLSLIRTIITTFRNHTMLLPEIDDEDMRPRRLGATHNCLMINRLCSFPGSNANFTNSVLNTPEKEVFYAKGVLFKYISLVNLILDDEYNMDNSIIDSSIVRNKEDINGMVVISNEKEDARKKLSNLLRDFFATWESNVPSVQQYHAFMSSVYRSLDDIKHVKDNILFSNPLDIKKSYNEDLFNSLITKVTRDYNERKLFFPSTRTGYLSSRWLLNPNEVVYASSQDISSIFSGNFSALWKKRDVNITIGLNRNSMQKEKRHHTFSMIGENKNTYSTPHSLKNLNIYGTGISTETIKIYGDKTIKRICSVNFETNEELILSKAFFYHVFPKVTGEEHELGVNISINDDAKQDRLRKNFNDIIELNSRTGLDTNAINNGVAYNTQLIPSALFPEPNYCIHEYKHHYDDRIPNSERTYNENGLFFLSQRKNFDIYDINESGNVSTAEFLIYRKKMIRLNNIGIKTDPFEDNLIDLGNISQKFQSLDDFIMRKKELYDEKKRFRRERTNRLEEIRNEKIQYKFSPDQSITLHDQVRFATNGGNIIDETTMRSLDSFSSMRSLFYGESIHQWSRDIFQYNFWFTYLFLLYENNVGSSEDIDDSALKSAENDVNILFECICKMNLLRLFDTEMLCDKIYQDFNGTSNKKPSDLLLNEVPLGRTPTHDFCNMDFTLDEMRQDYMSLLSVLFFSPNVLIYQDAGDGDINNLYFYIKDQISNVDPFTLARWIRTWSYLEDVDIDAPVGKTGPNNLFDSKPGYRLYRTLNESTLVKLDMLPIVREKIGKIFERGSSWNMFDEKFEIFSGLSFELFKNKTEINERKFFNTMVGSQSTLARLSSKIYSNNIRNKGDKSQMAVGKDANDIYFVATKDVNFKNIYNKNELRDNVNSMITKNTNDILYQIYRVNKDKDYIHFLTDPSRMISSLLGKRLWVDLTHSNDFNRIHSVGYLFKKIGRDGNSIRERLRKMMLVPGTFDRKDVYDLIKYNAAVQSFVNQAGCFCTRNVLLGSMDLYSMSKDRKMFHNLKYESVYIIPISGGSSHPLSSHGLKHIEYEKTIAKSLIESRIEKENKYLEIFKKVLRNPRNIMKSYTKKRMYKILRRYKSFKNARYNMSSDELMTSFINNEKEILEKMEETNLFHGFSSTSRMIENKRDFYERSRDMRNISKKDHMAFYGILLSSDKKKYSLTKGYDDIDLSWDKLILNSHMFKKYEYVDNRLFTFIRFPDGKITPDMRFVIYDLDRFRYIPDRSNSRIVEHNNPSLSINFNIGESTTTTDYKMLYDMEKYKRRVYDIKMSMNESYVKELSGRQNSIDFRRDMLRKIRALMKEKKDIRESQIETRNTNSFTLDVDDYMKNTNIIYSADDMEFYSFFPVDYRLASTEKILFNFFYDASIDQIKAFEKEIYGGYDEYIFNKTNVHKSSAISSSSSSSSSIRRSSSKYEIETKVKMGKKKPYPFEHYVYFSGNMKKNQKLGFPPLNL